MSEVIVLGAGHNGLVAACQLAKMGKKVLVIDKGSVAGGLGRKEEFASGFFSNGIHHDTTTLRPQVVKNLKLERHGLKYEQTEPPIFAPEESGTGLAVHRSPEAMKSEPLSEGDFAKYKEMRDFYRQVGPVISQLFNEIPADPLRNTPANLMHLASTAFKLRRLGKEKMMEFFRIAPMCVADWLNEWFSNDLFKCALSAPAYQCAFSGPWSPGNTANLLIKECTSDRTVAGGPATVIASLLSAAKDGKVEFRLNTVVEELIVEKGAVKGVKLAGGEELQAERVVSTVDPKTLFLNLIPSFVLPQKFEQRIEHFRMNGTVAKVNFAIDGELRFDCRPDQQIEFARTGEHFDDIERAFDHIKYREFSKRPVLDIYVPSVSDPSCAPAGKSVVSVLVFFAPYNLDGGWNDAQRKALYDNVLSEIGRYSKSFSEQIIESEVLTPKDIEERFGCAQGHIYHGEHALDQLMVRPSPECAYYNTPVSGLYQCGSGSHPGGGITGMPGYLGAQQVA